MARYINDKKVRNLRKYREEKGYSLRELAEAIHSDHTAISYWERGIKTPNLKNLKKLEEFFDADSDELMATDPHYADREESEFHHVKS